ncbi:MAG: ATP-dependent helicase HrpB [Bacteroidota bacterium]|nr:ATP-dependent helicase HrpB [Bacteroidota bacterium]
MTDFSYPNLPVTKVIPLIQEKLNNETRLVLEASPGAGKTTIVPLALLSQPWIKKDKIIVLEPRRLAARAAAMRMAQILGETVGITVGYKVKLESKISLSTRIEVVTEGVLTRMIQDDPALEGIGAIIFDEFHERNLQSDLGLALAINCQLILRPDLRLIIMSATLDAERIAFWFKASAIKCEGRQFPVTINYLLPEDVKFSGTSTFERIKQLVPKAVRKALKEQKDGDILVFLPGLKEIKKVAELLEYMALEKPEIHMLHGELSLQQQQLAIEPSSNGSRKIILSTSISETSITIEGVKAVIDTGFSRISKFSARSGLSSLLTVPASKAAVAQRSGRAGRLGPGLSYRLWTQMEQHQRAEHSIPEILEADQSSLALELSLWGIKDPNDLQWLDAPPPAALSQARELLVQLGAIDPDFNPLPHGRKLAILGLQPRLAHLVIKGQEYGLGETACVLAALIGERDIFKPWVPMHVSSFLEQPDLRLRLEVYNDPSTAPMDVQVDHNILNIVRKQANFLKQRLNLKPAKVEPNAAGLLISLAYPDRVGQIESFGRIRLRSGQKVSLATELFEKSEFFAISRLDVLNGNINLAAPLQKKDLITLFSGQVQVSEDIYWDHTTSRVVAKKFSRLDALVLEEIHLTNPDPEKIAEVLQNVIIEKGLSLLSWPEHSQKIRKRLSFLHNLDHHLWPDVSDDALLNTIDEWLRPYLYDKKSLDEIKKIDPGILLINNFSYQQKEDMDKLAPPHIVVPSGSHIEIDYSNIDAPVLAVRLQEIFGLQETPKIANGKVPLLIHLLSPARRPVQITQDLRSFWKSGYFEVRKALRAQYPKHSWPEDPITAQAVKGIKKRI